MGSTLSLSWCTSASTDQIVANKPKTIVFIDKSGSTNSFANYWESVLTIVESEGNDDVLYYCWNNKAILAHYEEVLTLAKSKNAGEGGTSPECFAPIASEGSHIIIITDGQVSEWSVALCDKILQSREFASVKVHFLTQEGHFINLSVSAPFTRKTDYVLYHNKQVLAAGSTRKCTVLREYFGEPERFLIDAEGILQELTVANMGIESLQRRNELLDLQKNLLATLASQNAPEVDRFAADIRAILLSPRSSLSDCHEKMRQFICDSGPAGKRIESAIQLMINQCSGSSNYSFANLEPGRLQRAQALDPATATDVTPQQEQYNGSFQCPITLDTDLPTLLIATGDPVLRDLEKKYVDNIITNPFLLLNDPTLVQKVQKRLDHVFGLEGTRLLFSAAETVIGGQERQEVAVKSPITRRPISTAITLGLDEAHKEATNFALADLLFGRKLVGQPEIWLAVIYFIIKDIPYLNSEVSFIVALKAHMVHRMRTQTTFMSLSGLPVDPMVRCPVDIAIWYCVNSPLIVRNSNPLEDDRNRLRSFGAGARYMAELLEGDVLGYPYDRAWTLRQLSLYKAFAWMMKEDKSDDPKVWRMKLRAQYQNSLTLSDGTVVLLDGSASLSGQEPPPLVNSTVSIGGESYTLSVGELVALSRLVDRTKTVGVVKIPLDLQAAVEGQDYKVVKNYGYELGADVPLPVPISPFTLRPYSIDRKERKHWQLVSESMFGPINKQLSTHSLFLKYVVDYKQFPASQEELIKYMATKQANREDGQAKDTLPTQAVSFVSDVFASYESVLGGPGFTDITAEEFIHKTNTSRDKTARMNLDEVTSID